MEEKKPKNKGGRPSKYKPEYCQRVINLMSSGYDFRACCGNIGISHDTGYQWIKKHPEFADAVKEGRSRCYEWFLNQGLKNLDNKSFNSTVWYMMMKNIHQWKDKHETEIKTESGAIQVTFKKEEKK